MTEHLDPKLRETGAEEEAPEAASGPTFLERLNVVAIAAALILLLGALGYRAGLFESSPASASFGQDGGQAAVQASGGCGPGGCPTGPGTRTGGCGGPGGGCGSSSGPVDIKALQRYVADAYAKATDDTGFDVVIKDFGCHQEAGIIKDGKTLRRLAISGGRIYELD
jgi:hypothetical protein